MRTERTKKKTRQLRCAVCHERANSNLCAACEDPRCGRCGQRLLTLELEAARGFCATCDPKTARFVRHHGEDPNRGRVAIVLTE